MRIWRCHLGSLLRTFVFGTFVLTIVTCWLLVHQYNTTKNNPSNPRRATVSFATGKCYKPPDLESLNIISERATEDRNGTTKRLNGGQVLIFYRHTSISFRLQIVTVLEANRIHYKLAFVTPKTALPFLVENGRPKYHVIVFESFKFYLGLSVRNRAILDNYLREHGVGLLHFTGQENFGFLPVYFTRLHLRLRTGVGGLYNAEINPQSSLLRLTRAGGLVEGSLAGSDWVTFTSNHSTYEPVEFASRDIKLHRMDHHPDEPFRESIITKQYTTVMLDKGLLDGVKKVYFGNGLNFWLHKLLFMDSLSYLSGGVLEQSLNRWILIDIDDIFVGKTGIRMTADDVQALISVQRRIESRVPGFKFNLGFSGFHFMHGTKDEIEGDKELIRNANKFWWFSHMFSHRKPHQITTIEAMKTELLQNAEFAQKHGIPLNTSYAVAPHHSGVYPAYDLLYEGWTKHYGLTVTSTEEYPHLNPPRLRKGFIYKGIKVLPRQTCGLYTRTLHLKSYPKGPQRLENSIYGGELFQTIVNTPINIFMTHMSNYGNDRLALHTFENVIKYLQCWTNLRLRTEHPVSLAERYFNMYPEEKEPLWGNPCTDKRHRYIWPKEKTCTRLPSFLIVGPQKTGTTALYMFLLMHPDFVSNEHSVKTYEEVQFFSGRNYLKGLDWYLDFFPDVGNATNRLLFEKTANYFDSPKAARRAFALLPRAKIITILTDPVKRAYSWYQHVRSHGVDAAVKNSFYDVLTKSNASRDRGFHILGQRSLVPGLYAYHLEKWLTYYPPSQILIIDGDMLKTSPADVMLEVQQFLGVNAVFDYNTKLRFDKRKGFFCQITSQGGSKCLGKSKGRRYPPIDKKSRQFLEEYYREPNSHLVSVLRRIGKPLPNWLVEKHREE